MGAGGEGWGGEPAGLAGEGYTEVSLIRGLWGSDLLSWLSVAASEPPQHVEA